MFAKNFEASKRRDELAGRRFDQASRSSVAFDVTKRRNDVQTDNVRLDPVVEEGRVDEDVVADVEVDSPPIADLVIDFFDRRRFVFLFNF